MPSSRDARRAVTAAAQKVRCPAAPLQEMLPRLRAAYRLDADPAGWSPYRARMRMLAARDFGCEPSDWLLRRWLRALELAGEVKLTRRGGARGPIVRVHMPVVQAFCNADGGWEQRRALRRATRRRGLQAESGRTTLVGVFPPILPPLGPKETAQEDKPQEKPAHLLAVVEAKKKEHINPRGKSLGLAQAPQQRAKAPSPQVSAPTAPPAPPAPTPPPQPPAQAQPPAAPPPQPAGPPANSAQFMQKLRALCRRGTRGPERVQAAKQQLGPAFAVVKGLTGAQGLAWFGECLATEVEGRMYQAEMAARAHFGETAAAQAPPPLAPPDPRQPPPPSRQACDLVRRAARVALPGCVLPIRRLAALNMGYEQCLQVLGTVRRTKMRDESKRGWCALSAAERLVLGITPTRALAAAGAKPGGAGPKYV